MMLLTNKSNILKVKVLIFLITLFPYVKSKAETFPSLLMEADSSKGLLAKGTVYNDLNQNRIMDEDEPGIPGVLVSNGVNIVQTDKNGRYRIPVTDDTIIFIIKPRDWMPPLNALNLPQFYYIHKPNGSPESFKYEGVKPTGPLPESINFPLYADKSESKFKMIVFGDPQPYNEEQIDFFTEDIIAELIGVNDVSFGMTMGDIVGDDLELFTPLNQAVSKIGIPWYNVLGNHDVNFQAARDERSDETFERVFGPPNYAFVYGDVHFIVVDNVIMNAPAGNRGYVGGLRSDQLTFVKNYLERASKDDLIVLNMHIPLAQHGQFRQSDQKALFDLLKEFPNTLSISAHTHTQNNTFFHADDSDWQREIPHHHFNVGTTSGNWWNGIRDEHDVPHTRMRDGTPNGYSYITFNGTTYLIDWKVAGKPKDHKMNIHVPRGVAIDRSETLPVTVNFFNGSEQSELHFRILGETTWMAMDKVDKPDPYYEKIYKRHQRFLTLDFPKLWRNSSELMDEPYPISKRLSKAENSTHLWEAKVGVRLPTGIHIVEVKAIDRYGRIFKDYQTLRILESKTP